MNKFRQWISVSLLVVGLAGCSSSEQPNPVKVIEIDPDLPAMTEQEMAAHFTGDRFVVLNIAVSPRTEQHVNDFAISLLGEKNIVPFGSVHPDSENALKELDRLKNA